MDLVGQCLASRAYTYASAGAYAYASAATTYDIDKQDHI